jgi:predicted ATPase
VLEDLHWASESTLQLLHYLVARSSLHPVLMIGTFRSEAIGTSPAATVAAAVSQRGLAEH